MLGISLSIPAARRIDTWTPLQLANLAGWWDVSQAAGVTTGTGGISSLNDLSGNSRHLTQATSAKRPALTTGGQNGRDVATFDGVDDFMSAAWVRAQPFSVFAALSVRANAGGSSTIIGFDTWAGAGNYLYMSTGLRTLTVLWCGSASIGPIDMSNGAFAAVGIVANGASSVIARNGTETTGNPSTMAASALSLGDATDQGSVNSAITVGEVIAVSAAVDATTRGIIRSYLTSKWGVV